jgi:hypothetical protein
MLMCVDQHFDQTLFKKKKKIIERLMNIVTLAEYDESKVFSISHIKYLFFFLMWNAK